MTDLSAKRKEHACGERPYHRPSDVTHQTLQGTLNAEFTVLKWVGARTT